MQLLRNAPKYGLFVILTLVLSGFVAFSQQTAGSLRGQVADQFGGFLVGATVTLTDVSGAATRIQTDSEGNYVFSSLKPGRYQMQAEAKGFALYAEGLEIAAGRQVHNVRLGIKLEDQKVTVEAESRISTDPENNASGLVLRGSDLDALPDDPADLAMTLQALAGPGSGPNGGQLFVDGFTPGGQLPSKATIREIRISRNPFSAENDRLGFGRIDITTVAGTDKFHGDVTGIFSDESLNSRNPFASQRAPYQFRSFGGLLSGSVIPKRSTFLVLFEKRVRFDNAIINATIVDPSFNITPFNQAVVTPWNQNYLRTQYDHQINPKHRFTVQYMYIPTSLENAGVGSFSLLSRAYKQSTTEHILRFWETAILSPQALNETRFQFMSNSSKSEGDNTVPTIRVLEAFTGGGSDIGLAANNTKRWELHNYTTVAQGTHTWKFGGRLRRTAIRDDSSTNFGGTYLFAGTESLNSIERYRRTLVLQEQGLTPSEIRALGGGASQFSLASGNPTASISQTDLGFSVQDDWRLRPNFTLSLGLRYEWQNNIKSTIDLGPRLAFAWSPVSGGRPSKMVVRGGFGIFFDRFSENYSLSAQRFNGLNQQQFISTDTAILDLFPNAPSGEMLTSFAVPQTIRRVATDLRAPYMMQSALSVERQLPRNTTLAVSYISTRALHVLRSRNVNAPVISFAQPGTVPIATIPSSELGNIYEYESSGIFKQQQLILTLSSRFNPKLSFFATYAFNKADSDTDGAAFFPADTYDLSGEFGRAALDVRHRFNLSGSYQMPWKVGLTTLLVMRSGGPFNITTGTDSNGDTIFTERPAFATDLSRPGVVQTRFGAFDLKPLPGQTIIPRNFGSGPSFFGMNLGINRTFSFGDAPTSAKGAAAGQKKEKLYKLIFAAYIYNVLNHTNPAAPIGNLSSPLFGQSNQTSTEASFSNATSNRRVMLRMTFTF